MVRRTPATPSDLDLSLPIAVDWRPDEVWHGRLPRSVSLRDRHVPKGGEGASEPCKPGRRGATPA